MNAFKFDPYAELAKIQNQNPEPAIVATLATEQRLPVETVAEIAGIAGSGVEIEKSSCPVVDLFERIGIMDEAGNRDCYDLAALDLGYASFDDAIQQIVDRWFQLLDEICAPCLNDARANRNQIEIAAREGWGEIELFGRYSGLINRLDGDRIRHVHKAYATTLSGAIYPRSSPAGAWPIWEVAS